MQLMECYQSQIFQNSSIFLHYDVQMQPIHYKTQFLIFYLSFLDLFLLQKDEIEVLAMKVFLMEFCSKVLTKSFWIQDSCFQGTSQGLSQSNVSMCICCSYRKEESPQTVHIWWLRETISQRYDYKEVLKLTLEPYIKEFL